MRYFELRNIKSKMKTVTLSLGYADPLVDLIVFALLFRK